MEPSATSATQAAVKRRTLPVALPEVCVLGAHLAGRASRLQWLQRLPLQTALAHTWGVGANHGGRQAAPATTLGLP